MSRRIDKIALHTRLTLLRLGLSRPPFREIADRPVDTTALPTSLRVHYWTPDETAGANVNVHDMLPALQRRVQELGLGWRLTAGPALPEESCDWLICFKSVPPDSERPRHRRTVLLICDKAETFWPSIPGFDMAIATSSRPFAAIVAGQNPRTVFIGETEPTDYIEAGREALRTPPSRRPPVLLWHGQKQSRQVLPSFRDAIADTVHEDGGEFHIVSGPEPEREERWGKLRVRFFPWSRDRMKASAATARLGFLPARESVRSSYIKPASRMRCLYALGAPAIGDGRVPDVRDFAGTFGGPVASTAAEWRARLAELWRDPARLDRLAADGHRQVSERYTTRILADRWIHLLAEGK